MAFGDYSVMLSLLEGPDENPLSENGAWSNRVFTFDSDMKRVDDAAGAAGTAGSAWWNSVFLRDVEVSYTVTEKPGTVGDWIRLFGRLQTPGTDDVSGYMIQASTQSGADTVELYRVDTAGSTQIGVANQEFQVGDLFGLKCEGNDISVWYSSQGDPWVQLFSVVDDTYFLAGFVGLGSKSAVTGRMRKFKGGNVVPFPTPLTVSRIGSPSMTR